MKLFKFATGFAFAAALSACGATDNVSRNAPFGAPQAEPVAFAQTAGPIDTQGKRNLARVSRIATTDDIGRNQALPQEIAELINVSQVKVTVPRSLRVSEANRYYPTGDIVWREDPIGDRHAQVAQIFHDALRAGTAQFDGDIPVILDIRVERFHALTEKARYTVGGVHSIRFAMVMRDAKTGQALSEPHVVQADLDAFGGQQAITAEARGLTQKVRISQHLGEVIRQELIRPEGYENANLGFFQAVNKI
ncbi:DUF6778 family protein [Sulfitobacter sp. S190]|uniref:DUF6778 family protein n=1 Tax=Sulfitobacter sp. S190 TaxID=2867022 RepID=UPI0021A48DC6|nr:DUF6778 family protein [Sulfitobacter sp. S190]UWR20930.1 hypothetical protein K3756_09330 [Sulfitobacter sp. S190]